MRKLYQNLLVVLLATVFSLSAGAQQNYFSSIPEGAIKASSLSKRVIIPEKYATTQLDISKVKAFLWSLPSDKNLNRAQAPVFEVPMPNGKTARFRVWESSVMEPALAAKFPEIRTFAGQGIDDPYANIRFDYNPYFGFSAQILSVSGRVFIDPYSRGDINYYMSYYANDARKLFNFNCRTKDRDATEGLLNPHIENVTGPCRGTQLATYRLVVACTGEYAQTVGGGTAGGTHAAIVTAINRINQVYETELSVHVNLVANNNLVEYLNPATDPYLNDADTDLDTNTPNVNSVIGSGNYDYGHLFCTTDGGVAYLRSVCSTSGGTSGVGGKAGGLTGLPNPVGDPFYIDYVAHEMGHQFGGNHTFNSTTGSCGGGNRTASAAYEVGSATTIMGYAGICGSTNNIQSNSDPYFHTNSFDEASNHISGSGGCGVLTATGNNIPVITSMSNNGASIPVNTPFTLTGAATDADGDALTYDWEEWDLGSSGNWNAGATSTTAPLFKSRIPKTSGSRTFPDPAVIAANYPANPPATMGGLKGETLPTVARAMKFRLTVRDNRAGGGGVVTGGNGCGTFSGTFQVNTIAGATFAVTVPNGGESYAGGSTQTVTWNNTNTTTAPISVANVKISYSTDGGLTFPTVLVASTANDGSEAVVIPVGATTTARIKVEALGNIFFDISNADFNVTAATTPTFTFVTPADATVACGGPASASTTLATTSVSGFTTPINLVATGMPGTTTISYSVNPVIPGSSTVVTLNGTNTLTAGTYPVTITGTAGAEVKTVTINYIVSPGTGPAITAQPASQTICANNTVTFSVTSAAATSFQWQVSTNGGGNWTDLANTAPYSGVTTNTLTITNAPVTLNTYQYRAIAKVNCGSTNSSAATLTINTAPAITANPVAVTVCAGASASFSATATGAGLTYQWQLSTAGAGGPWNPVPTGAPYSGINTATLTINPTAISMNGYRYRVVVSGTCPSPATSTDALLTVINPVTITTNPADVTTCANGNASFTAAGSSSIAIIYQWQESTSGTGGPWNNITNGGIYSGATTATLTLTGVSAGMSGNRYRVLMSNATCTSPATSNNALLTVQVAPAITGHPADATVCVPNSATFNSIATGTNLAYVWQVSVNGAGGPWVNLVNGGSYSGVNTNTLTVNPTTLGLSGSYYRVSVSGSCAPVANSGAALLTVIAPVAITTQPVASGAVCNTYNRSFSVTASSTIAINYQWQVSTNGGGAWTSLTNTAPYSGVTTNTLTITGATLAMNNNQYRVLLSNNVCTSPTTSNAAVLVVNPLPAVVATANPASVCTGTVSTLTASGADTYSWGAGTTPSTGAVVTVTPVVNPASPSLPATTTYTVTGTTTATGCFNTATVNVIAEPLPVVTLTPASPAALVPDQRVTLTASITPAGGNFAVKWFKDGVDINFTGTSKVVTVNDLGTYRVRVSNATTGLCSSESNAVTIAAAPSERLFIYPTPTSGRFTVAYYNAGAAATQQGISIYDSKGAVVFSKNFSVTQPYQLHVVDLSRNGKGTYYVVLRDASGKRIKTGSVSIK